MTSQNLAFVSMTLGDKLDEPTKLFALKQCENLDDSAVSSLSAINLKSPITGLVWHCFLGLFGAGRFYKGNGLLGALYIVFFVLLCIVADYDEDMAGFLFFVYIVFVYVDCFFIYKGIQKDNWQKLQNFFLVNTSNKDKQ